ncbi:MAG: type II toxin-antitoxin system RelE/ParE family toxin [Isosphaerales bacterium]
MSYRVIFAPRARADTLEAFQWIAERPPDTAARWYEGLENAMTRLGEFPDRTRSARTTGSGSSPGHFPPFTRPVSTKSDGATACWLERRSTG